ESEIVFDGDRQKLWDTYVGDDSFWVSFSSELPGFLEALLYLSPEMFVAFFAYCAIPWQSGQVSAHVKELAAMACDIMPSHRFGPGFRVHLANAIKLGVGRSAIMESINIASAAPEPVGYDCLGHCHIN